MSIHAFKSTSDNWAGNFKIENDARYQGGYVEVSLLKLGPDFYVHRVCVWGNDDRGMEFDTEDELEAKEVFQKVILMDDVTFEKLQQLGFDWA